MGSTRREDDPLDLLGEELLGRYRVEATIAYGGMSVVYQGNDSRLRRPVCIKVFHRLDPREPAYRTTYEHFVQEAFALSQLKHPNTLRIYDFGYLDHEPRSPFHVCEFLDGGTLSQHIRRGGPLPGAAVLEVMEPVIGALSEAHARGVVHRDLKPNNVLFGSAGTSRVVKLVDFGIAKSLASEDAMLPHQAEDTSAAAGQRISLYSPGWCAPEQLRAETIGPTADVFALGLLTAYLLSGKTIFSARGGDDALDERIAGDEHVAKRLRELKLDPMMAHVIARACRDLPEERYASVEELGLALRAAVHSDATVTAKQRMLAPEPRDTRPSASGTPPPVRVPMPLPLPLPAPVLVLGNATDAEILVAGRRLRVLPVHEKIDLGGEAGPLRSPARLRLTLLPDAGRGVRLHVKGLNCFVTRVGERPTGAVSLDTDQDLELVAPDRKRMDVLRCLFGVPGEDRTTIFALGAVTLAVPAQHIQSAILLDLGPGRELVLLHPMRKS